MDILVDSCIWVKFFSSKSPLLRSILKKNQACVNEVILMELIPTLKLGRNFQSVELLKDIKKIPLSIDWGHLQEIRIKNFQNGINNVGIADLIILQQSLQNKLPICSIDKQFKLMQQVFGFELIEG